MLHSLVQGTVINSGTHEGFMTVHKTPTANAVVSTPKPNYLKMLNRCGIRREDKVLVIGGANVEMLQKMARLVGIRGEITVLDDEEAVVHQLQAAADAKKFKAFKHFSGGHPAFDMRSDAQKYVPVKVTITQMTSPYLPFADKEFDIVWIESLSDSWSVTKCSELILEVERVAHLAVNAKLKR